LALLWKESHKCAPFGKISKNGPWPRCHGLRRRAYSHGALDLGAEVVQFLAGVCERGVRRGQGLGALIHGAELLFITWALFPVEPYSFFLYLLLFLLFYIATFRFLSFDHKNFDLIRRLWQGRYLLVPSQF
jgi:hypothetical protein